MNKMISQSCMFRFLIIIATSLGAHINGVIKRSGPSGRAVRSTTSCILPPYPDHGTYEVINANDTEPGQSCESFVLSVSCFQGYGLQDSNTPHHYANSTLVYCIQGLWPQTMPKCVRFCKLDADPSVDYMCYRPNMGLKSCYGLLASGTLINPICKSPHYYSTEVLLNMECISGKWNYIAKCKAECGRVTPKHRVDLIIDGSDAIDGQVPWHVGIYRKTSTPYKHICGGTIISNNVIISAAHCFWSNTYKKIRPPSDYGVAGGKIYRPWDDKVDVHAQKSDVKEIYVPRLFLGVDANFGEDIAGLILVTSFVYNSFVTPVCLNFDGNFNRLQLRHGNLGKVAGWGLAAVNGAASPILQVVDLPFINEDTCIDTLPRHFRPYITGDKFCAGYTNGTALCKGDSGGGLAFPDMELGIERHYLRGIASTAPTSDMKQCNDNVFITFTKISKHQEFILNLIAVSVRNQGTDCTEGCADGPHERKPVTSTEKISPEAGNYRDCTPPRDRVPLNLMIYPRREIIRYGGDTVVLNCRDEGPLRAKVKWHRERGLIKNGSVDLHGRLEMFQVTYNDSGIYVCEASDYAGHPGAQVRISIMIREFPCRRNEVACDNVRCISKMAVCDYKIDCADGSDEKNCPPAGCEPDQFKCKNSKCILKTWVCDSEDDCGDNSDEQNCNVQVNV